MICKLKLHSQGFYWKKLRALWIKLFKCCTVGVAVYSALTSPLIHLSASPIKAVRVRVSHLQPLQNLLNLFISLLYRFSHRFFLFENQANHEIRFSTFFDLITTVQHNEALITSYS